MTAKSKSLMTRPSEFASARVHSSGDQKDDQGLTSLSPSIALLFSVTCGLAVANVYFAQPLLDSMAHSLGVATERIGIVVTMTQIGYALGLLLLVPLGDLVNRKRLVLTQIVLCAFALAAVGASSTWPVLLAAMVGVGLMAVLVQVLVAYSAVLAAPSQRGQAIGTVTSGIVLGILLARFIAGLIADLAGWRAVYFVSSGLMLALAAVLCKYVPDIPTRQTKGGYAGLIRSLFALLLNEPVLQIRGLLALLIFAAFSVLWTALVLPLSAPPLSLPHTVIGLFGLAGVAGALAARRAGGWADRGLGSRVSGLALGLLTLSWLPIGFAQTSLLALVGGIVVLDFAVQAVHVTNQSLIFAARPDAQSRMVGVYMFFYSTGSALGATAATQTYARWGWPAVSLLGAAISATAWGLWFLTSRCPTSRQGRPL